MKNNIKSVASVLILAMLFFTACKKEGSDKMNKTFGDEDAILLLEKGYVSNVIVALEKPVDYPYYTKGVIEYRKNGSLEAVVDYGDGTRDVWATVTKGSNTENFDLSCKKKDAKYKKVIVKPLVKIDGCNYIVEGIIKYYEGDTWVATVDYGDGTCDEWATKTWSGGSKTFSMKK